MLEHSAMYLNVPPQYEDDTSLFPDFYTTRLGPCELQDPVWAKMSALAAGVNKKRKKSETKPQAQINKCNNEKRRREQENIYIEELAELISANFADMSSLSVKPDKSAILQETVNQIRSIRQRELATQSQDPVQQGEVSSSRPTILSNEVYGPLLLEALEGFLFVINSEGRVEYVTENVIKYTKYSREEIHGKSIYNIIHPGDHARFSHILMPMSVGCWGSNSEEDSTTTTTTTTTTTITPTQQTTTTTTTVTKGNFSVRFLIKLPETPSGIPQPKEPDVQLMYISSTQLKDQVALNPEDDNNSDSGPYVLCVASRVNTRDKGLNGVEQFTTKLDISGNVTCVDTSGVSEKYGKFINKDFMDRPLRDLVQQDEVHKLTAHLRDALTAGQATSGIYKLQIGEDKFVEVQTKSKLFKSNPNTNDPNEVDFIMATHTIICADPDKESGDDPGGGGGGGIGSITNSLNDTITTNNDNNNNNSGSVVGGPLMTSVVNGTTTNNRNSGGGTNVSSVSSDSSTASSTNNTLLNSVVNANAVTSFTTLTIDSDYAFEFLPSSSTGMGWDFEPTSWIDTTTSTPPTSATATTSTTIGTIQQRPESRQSNTTTTTTPVSTPTPRPPSNPSYSPCGTTNIAQSPFSGGSSNNSGTQASPSTPSGSTTTTTTNNPYTFPFSPLTEQNYPTNLVGSATSNDNNDKDTKANLLDDPSTNMMVDSGKLRDLLTKPPADSSGNSSTGANSNNNNNNNDPDGRNKNRILKSLLKQQDEDDNRTSPRGGSSVSLIRNSGNNTTTGGELPKTSTSGGNNMLLQLLNEKSDDDDLEAKAGVKKKNELFHQLIKTAENRNSDDDKKNDIPTSHDDSLLRSLGFTSSPSPPGDEPGKARKRPSDDRDDNPNKRTADGSQVSSSGGSSKLCERNKMLASLLAKQPNNHQPIPPVPASVISATPHEKLPRVTLDPNINKTMPNRLINQNMSHQNIGNNRVNNTRLGGVRQQQQQQQPQQNTSYLTSILTPNNLQQHQQQQQQQQRTTDNRQQMVNSTCFNTATTTSPATSSTTNDNLTWNSINDNNNMHMNDPFLSELLDQVIDIVPEDMMHILDGNDGQQQNNFQGVLSEKMAINIIQKSLMQCETAVKSPSSPTISLPGTPPAYSSATMTAQNNNNNNQIRPFPPPPNYHQANFIQKQRMPIRTGLIGAVGTVAGAAVTASQYAVAAAAAGNNLVNAQLLLQQRKQTILQQQQEQKRRLLQQQQQQELLIPSNATAAEINSSLQNLDYNTVAPNVTLTRSTSLSESQLSPGYGNGNGNNSGGQQSQQQTQQQQQQQQPPPPPQQQQQTPNQRINQQQPYSPHSQLVSPLSNQQPNFQQTSNYQQARLSPQTAFNQQLSPRQTYPQGGVAGGQSQNWQQTQARLSLQNPMLNAQLTGNYITGGPNGRNFQRTPTNQQQQQQQPPPPSQQQQPTSQPQQRSINSPGAVTTRHSPYPADSFPPPTSPNSNVFSQNQYLRLQRANSVPTATTQLPGGLGSPRPYGREHHPHPPYHPPPPPPPQSQIPNQHHPHQQHPMMYQPQPPPQDTSQYCYDQAGIQLATAYNGADRGGRIPPPPHLQAGVTGSGPTSEFVRQELRAVVGARTGQQSQSAPPNSQQQQQPAPPPPPPPQQQPNRPPSSQLINQQQVDLEALGLTFEMPTSGASDSPKLWGAMGTDMGSMSPPQPATSRTTMEDGRAGDHTNKSSLLQKLLSE